ncbi:MAG: hypothetical protein EZS28_046269, partial [Streblomastix strix]
MNDYELIRDDKGYLIWPLEDATKLPIHAHGKVRVSNKAIFSMRDYSWLDNRKKWYGILLSNDGKQFYGLDGQNESVRLEVEIEEGEQFVNFIRFQLAQWWAWLVPPVVVGFLTLIISALVYKLWNDRYKKNKEAEHMKELQETRMKRRQEEEINRKNQIEKNEIVGQQTMALTDEDEVTTEMHQTISNINFQPIHFLNVENYKVSEKRKSQQETNSQSSPTHSFKQKSQKHINPRDDIKFADVMKVINKVSQSSSQSETAPSILKQLESLQTQKQQQFTDSFESFADLARIPSHLSATTIIMPHSQSSSFESNQIEIPSFSSFQSNQ